MIKQQELYEAFLTRVEPEHRAFAAELHELFVNNGCTVEIKPTSSGFLVSYKFACRIAERTQIQVPGLNGRVEEPVKSQKTT